MLRNLLGGLGLILAFAGASPALARGEFTSGNWEGSASFDGRKFQNCHMSASYKDGWEMIFLMDGGYNLLLGFDKDGLKMTEGDEDDFDMWVDNSKRVPHTFEAITETMFATKVRQADEWFRLLQRGNSLKIDVGDHVESFSLAGTNAALARLRQCVDTYR